MHQTTKMMSMVKMAGFVLGAALLAQTGAVSAKADAEIVGGSRDDGTTSTRPGSRSGPGYVRVRSISYAGSGCPAGSVSTNVSPDGGSFSLMWDQFDAEAGPGVALSAGRKNCQLALDLDFPSGWSYAVKSVDHRGFVSLESGTTATLTTGYYFQGQATTARLSTSFYGPASKDYLVRDTLGSTAQVWSPCGSPRALNINVQARVSSTSRAGSGLITLESPVGGTLGGMTLEWQRCR